MNRKLILIALLGSNIFYSYSYQYNTPENVRSIDVQSELPELILQYKFNSLSDESGKYTGTLGGSAILSQQNGIPTLSLGSRQGYFDMGTSVGNLISTLDDSFTISMNVYIPQSYRLGDNGNFIFNFGNSSDRGYMFFSANNTRYSITRSNYNGESTISMNQTFTQGEWVNLTYTQKQNEGTIYLNGEKTKTGYVSMLPNVLGNTVQNWLGRSPYYGDVYLKDACYNDIRIYNGAITEDIIEEVYDKETLNKLNEAIYSEQIEEFIASQNFNFENLRTDIILPTSYDNGISAKWVSSNEEYIKNNGEITRPKQDEENASVTLTATFTKGNASKTKEFQATVIARMQDNEALAYDLDNIQLTGNINNLRNDLSLPSYTTEGSIITWTSDNPEYISNSGKLMQLSPSGNGKKEITLTATAHKNGLKKSKDFKVSVAEKENFDSYLFVYFPNNYDENLYYAISKDGYNYTPLNNGERIMWSDSVAIKKGIRDPHILRGQDGKTFYMVATDMKSAEGWSSNRGIVMYKSNDMIHWQHSTVHFPERFPEWKNVTRVWAPETIWDPDYENEDGTKGRYMIYFSLLTNDGKCTYDKVFYSYANDDFTGLISDPVYLYDRGSATIDANIIFDERDSTYHMIYKNEGSGGICQVTSKRLTAEPGKADGSQWSEASETLQQTNVAVEGGGMYKLIDSDTWILMYDCYSSGYYQFCSTEDLENFTLRAQTTTSGAFTPRHGTVIPISKEETDKLLSAFPSDNIGAYLIDAQNRNIKKDIMKVDGSDVYLPVRAGTDITMFDPEIEVPCGSSITPAGKQDFSNGPIEYTIENQGNVAKYNVTVEICHNTAIDGLYAEPDIIFSKKTGRFYIYAISDGAEKDQPNRIEVFSSADMVNWQKETDIAEGYLSSPSIEEKEINGETRYYIYYNEYNNETSETYIKTAVSDSPVGPFNSRGYIETSATEENDNLYPDIYTDNKSGKSYLYHGSGKMNVSALGDDMQSCISNMDITPSAVSIYAYDNAPHTFYRNGIYYFLWNNSEMNSNNSVVYGTAKSPEGPITMSSRRIVLSQNQQADIYGVSHCSVVQIPEKDEWYIVYQRTNKKYVNDRPEIHRELCIDKLNFDEDGSIIKVTATDKGIDPVDITDYIENGTTGINEISSDNQNGKIIKTEYINVNGINMGQKRPAKHGIYIKVDVLENGKTEVSKIII